MSEEYIDELEEQEDGEEEKLPQILIKCTLDYSLTDDKGQTFAEGEAKGVIDEETITLAPGFGETVALSFRDIQDIDAHDYSINMNLSSGENLKLTALGYSYENFLKILCKQRSEYLIADMLIQESLVKAGIEGDFTHIDDGGCEISQGECELRLYETALVIVPAVKDPVRIPYSLIEEYTVEDYKIDIAIENGERFILSGMGGQFDPFSRDLSSIMNKLLQKIQSYFKEVMPSLNPMMLRKAAVFMREGRAARRLDIEHAAPGLWPHMEKRIALSGMGQEYEFLSSLGQKDRAAIGVKRGLMGDLTGDYIWFLVPIFDVNNKSFGNAIAMEASSKDGAGKATYFFRISGRKEYRDIANMEILQSEADNMLKIINYSMLSINFRREPIYFSKEKLDDPQYINYRTAVQKLPALRMLRYSYIGRVIHSSKEQWRQDVEDLLKFNVLEDRDSEKWNKGNKKLR